MAQLSSDVSQIGEGMEAQYSGQDDTLSEDEVALLVERWEDQLEGSEGSLDWREWMVELENGRNAALVQYQTVEKGLNELEEQSQLLLQRQAELVGLMRDLVMEEEPTLLDDSLEDSLGQFQAEKRQEAIQEYEEELSRIEQALSTKDVSIRTHLQLIEDTREKLFELETEIEDMEMIHTPVNVLTTIDEE